MPTLEQGGHPQEPKLPNPELGREAYALTHVISQELNSIPHLQRDAEHTTNRSITRHFSYEKGGSHYSALEYILYQPHNVHFETLGLLKDTEGKQEYLQVETEYKNNELVGGAVVKIGTDNRKRINVFDNSTVPAVQGGWEFVTTKLGTPQDQTTTGK